MRVAPLALALALALLAPIAAAHLDRERPHIQPVETLRTPEVRLVGTTAHIDLLAGDPVRDLIRHEFDPARGLFRVEYRADPSVAADAFAASWSWIRLVEYRDVNNDLRFQQGVDSVARQWRPQAYTWETTEPTLVFVGGRTATSISWQGSTPNGPSARFIVAVAASRVTDEGARALSQDILIYADFADFPPRGVGHLYALETSLVAPADATVTRDQVSVSNATVDAGIRIRNPTRLLVYDWGAQAVLDGVDQFVNVTLSEPDDVGNITAILDFPRFDSTLHMVIVDGAEYLLPRRELIPDAGLALALLVLASLAALGAGPRRLKRAR